jgi:hypothetical protein
MVGDLFIVSLTVFPFVLVLGYILEMLIVRRNLGPFTIIKNALMYIGVFFHEISHYTICLLTGAPIAGISVKLRSESTGRVAPHGEVVPKKPNQMTFLQSVLMGLGPVLVGTWIIYFSLITAVNSLLHPLFRIISVLLIIAILLASTPSPADFHMMKVGFSNDPRHSIYQLLLFMLSILVSWGIVIIFNISFHIEFFYYFIIIGWYIALKYSFIGIRWGVNKIGTRLGDEQFKLRFRRFSRRRYKSSKFK